MAHICSRRPLDLENLVVNRKPLIPPRHPSESIGGCLRRCQALKLHAASSTLISQFIADAIKMPSLYSSDILPTKL